MNKEEEEEELEEEEGEEQLMDPRHTQAVSNLS